MTGFVGWRDLKVLLVEFMSFQWLVVLVGARCLSCPVMPELGTDFLPGFIIQLIK